MEPQRNGILVGADAVVHASRVGPLVGQVLIVEQRNRAPALREDARDFVEVALAGILEVPQPAARILAVFADHGDAIHILHRFGDRRADADPVFRRLLPSHVVFGKLVHIEIHGSYARRVPRAVQAVTVEQPADKDVGVRIRKPGIQYARHPRARIGCLCRSCVDQSRTRECRDPVSTCQNLTLSPNWNWREVLRCEVTCPKLWLVTEPLGELNCGVLNRL